MAPKRNQTDADRRRFLQRVGQGSIALALLGTAGCGGESESEPAGDGKTVDLLFVNTATAATLKDGKLTLVGVAPATLYFSDRPDRIAGHLPTTEFVEHWGVGGAQSFEADPPNAALSLVTGPVPQEIVVALREPKLEGDTLTFSVDVIDGSKEAEGQACSLFIDVIGRPLTPVSVAGGRRRVRRRTRRRN